MSTPSPEPSEDPHRDAKAPTSDAIDETSIVLADLWRVIEIDLRRISHQQLIEELALLRRRSRDRYESALAFLREKDRRYMRILGHTDVHSLIGAMMEAVYSEPDDVAIMEDLHACVFGFTLGEASGRRMFDDLRQVRLEESETTYETFLNALRSYAIAATPERLDEDQRAWYEALLARVSPVEPGPTYEEQFRGYAVELATRRQRELGEDVSAIARELALPSRRLHAWIRHAKQSAMYPVRLAAGARECVELLEPLRMIVAFVKQPPTSELRAQVVALWPQLDEETRRELQPALDGFLVAADLVEEAQRMLAVAGDHAEAVFEVRTKAFGGAR